MQLEMDGATASASQRKRFPIELGLHPCRVIDINGETSLAFPFDQISRLEIVSLGKGSVDRDGKPAVPVSFQLEENP